MLKSTPTPWTQHEDEPRVIVSAAEPTMSLLGLDSHDTAVIWSAEDAALIVHRVNVHDELLASLERTNALLVHLMKTVPWGKTSSVDFGELNDVLCALPGVIAKAKGGA